MAVALTQIITEDRASGAQVIDGSLRVDTGTSYTFRRTPGSDSTSQKKFTVSLWSKRVKIASGTTNNTGRQSIFYTGLSNGSGNLFGIEWRDDEIACIFNGAGSIYPQTTAKFRDSSSWYHIVVAVDTDQGTDTDRCKVYVNGVQQTLTGTLPTSGFSVTNGTTSIHCVAESAGSFRSSQYLSQFYYINDQQLTPSDFGFTDPLTNTWRPKKYTGTFTGTNSFYLPLDGNSSIGKDKSGNGNDFTPSGLGNLNTIEKATGAFPVLNTTNGGRVATVGTRTDSDSSSLVLAVPFVGNSTDIHQIIKGSGSAKTDTVAGSVAASTAETNFYGTSYKFAGSDSIHYGTNADFEFDGDFTIECWAYVVATGAQSLFVQNSGSNYFALNIDCNTGFDIYLNGGGVGYTVSKPFTNRWNHVAMVRSGSTITIYLNGIAGTTITNSSTLGYSDQNFSVGGLGTQSGGSYTGYMQDFRVYKGLAKYTSNFIPASTDPDILPDTPSGVVGGSALTKITDGAVGFNYDNQDYLTIPNDTDFAYGTGDFTWEAWIYLDDFNNGRYLIDHGVNEGIIEVFSSSGKIVYYNSTTGGSSSLYTTGFGSIAARTWYHVAAVRNSGTTSLYLNGKLSTSASDTHSYAGTSTVYIGRYGGGSSNWWDGHISNLRLIKGTALYTSDFTPPTEPLTNVTNTILLCCQSPTSATASVVTPGSITANNNPSPSNFNPFTTDINTVRGQESGYCVLSQITTFNGDGSDIQEGGLKFECPASGDASSRGTIPIPADFKFYMEARYTVAAGGAGQARLGIAQVQQGYTKSGTGIWSVDFRGSAGTIQKDDQGTKTTLTGNPSDGDIVGIKVDLVTGEFRAHRNGVYYDGGSALMTGISNVESYFFAALDGGINRNDWNDINFGQKPWVYPPGDGYQPLCLANLPRPTKIELQPDKYVGIVTYTGNGTARSITGLGFQPDLVWFKIRSSADSHAWYDSVRGVQERLQCDTTAAEGTQTQALSSFDSDGWSMGTDSQINANGSTYVAWAWKAGGAAVSNTDGSITSSVSVNQDVGFSIVSYTGNGSSSATVGHGLGVVPSMIIAKSRDTSEAWMVKHKDLASNNVLELANTNATADATGFSNGSLGNLTSTTTFGFVSGSLGVDSVNKNNDPVIAYCWSEVPGFSKFGSYTGNGSTNGPFIHLGFKPAWLLLKRIDSTSSWFMLDTTRDTYNVSENYLIADGNIAEGTYTSVDFLSNGFKPKNSSSSFNTDGATHVYAAFAEAPSFNLYGAQANAR